MHKNDFKKSDGKCCIMQPARHTCKAHCLEHFTKEVFISAFESLLYG
jgi:hypothetical protein